MSPNELIATHQCVDDEGIQYTLHSYQNYTESTDVTGKVWRRDTSISFVLSSGGEARPLDDETFEILATGKVIRRKRAEPLP